MGQSWVRDLDLLLVCVLQDIKRNTGYFRCMNPMYRIKYKFYWNNMKQCPTFVTFIYVFKCTRSLILHYVSALKRFSTSIKTSMSYDVEKLIFEWINVSE